VDKTSNSPRFIPSPEQRANDPLLASAYAAGLTEREVIDLMYKARRDTVAIMQRSMLSMHSVSMYVCERCGSRATYTGPTAADILGRPGESRG